jgi:hypothetical protein
MHSVRKSPPALRRQLDREVRPTWTLGTQGAGILRTESFVLDLLYVAAVIALFVAIGLAGKAVEKL